MNTYTMLKRASFRASSGSFASEASSPSSSSSPSAIFVSADSSPASRPSLILSTLRARKPPGYVWLTSEMYSEMFLGARSAFATGHGRTGQVGDESCIAASALGLASMAAAEDGSGRRARLAVRVW